jgi:hypothetical protein
MGAVLQEHHDSMSIALNWFQKLGSEVGHQKVTQIYDRSSTLVEILNGHRDDGEVLVSSMLDHREAYKIRERLSKISPVSFTHEPSDYTVIGVMYFTQIIRADLASRPFLMISAFCLVQIIRFHINPFTFSPPGMISLMNLFLNGKTICLRYTDDTQQPRLSQVVHKTNGMVHEDTDAGLWRSYSGLCCRGSRPRVCESPGHTFLTD